MRARLKRRDACGIRSGSDGGDGSGSSGSCGDGNGEILLLVVVMVKGMDSTTESRVLRQAVTRLA